MLIYKMAVPEKGNLPPDYGRYVEQAYKEVQTESPRLPEEGNGAVPVYIHDTKEYAGVTEIMPYHTPWGIETHAKSIGISRHVPREDIKRVAKHELRHVKSEKMLKYADLHPGLVRFIMESYAEYEGMLAAKKAGREYESEEIERKSPYKNQIKFAELVDAYYHSELGMEQGYRGFINDIFRYQSMHKALKRFNNCRRAARRRMQ